MTRPVLTTGLYCCLALLCLTSCRDDFSLEADYQDIPVAYAYLNADDDRHFVRVQKAFLESGGNALENAAVADSLYYGDGDATVTLTNGRTGQTFQLARVDGEDFDVNRTDGVFAVSPNILYTVAQSEIGLRGGDGVTLTINRPGEEDAVATTRLLDELEIVRPTDQVRIDDYRTPLVISWRADERAAIYDIRMIFTIRELFPDDPSRNRDLELEYVLNDAYVPGEGDVSSNSVRFETSKEAIFQFLGDNLEPNDDLRRRFRGFDVRIAAAGQEVLDRQTLAGANTGITSSQTLPRYTNLSGGIGLVTSTTVSIQEGVQLDDGSRDSLVNGFYTRDLGF